MKNIWILILEFEAKKNINYYAKIICPQEKKLIYFNNLNNNLVINYFNLNIQK